MAYILNDETEKRELKARKINGILLLLCSIFGRFWRRTKHMERRMKKKNKRTNEIILEILTDAHTHMKIIAKRRDSTVRMTILMIAAKTA